MSRARALLLAALGLALPAGLALAVYLTSAGDLGAVPAVVSVPSQQIASPAAATTQVETTGAATTAPPAQTGTGDDRDDDLPGKCKDPKHRLDPDCDPRTARDDDSDSSGSGSGSDSGDDDSSGKGSGGDRSDDDD